MYRFGVVGRGCEALSAKFGVSKRLIYFIINPEKAARAREQFKERQSEGRYKPKKEEWSKTMREHRAYKQKVIKNRVCQSKE
jgi:hypothetical protein